MIARIGGEIAIARAVEEGARMIAIKKQSNCVPPTDPPTFNCAFSLSFLAYSLFLLWTIDTGSGTRNGTTPAESGSTNLFFHSSIRVVFNSITGRTRTT